MEKKTKTLINRAGIRQWCKQNNVRITAKALKSISEDIESMLEYWKNAAEEDDRTTIMERDIEM